MSNCPRTEMHLRPAAAPVSHCQIFIPIRQPATNCVDCRTVLYYLEMRNPSVTSRGLPDQEPPDEPRVEAIAQTTRELVARCDAWLNLPGASENELKERTSANLYNQRLTWLDLNHRKKDFLALLGYCGS